MGLKEVIMKFRIIIDATTIRQEKDGLSQYIIGLINNLPESSFKIFEFIILINPGIEREELSWALHSGKFTILREKINSIGPKRDWDMFWFLLKNKNAFDLFHSTSNQYPLFLKKGVATIHDIIFSKYLDTPWWTFNFAKGYINTIIKNSLYRSAAVIAVSEATKNELVSHYKLSDKVKNKIHVIYEGWEHLLADRKGEEIPSLPFNSNYLFYVGSSRIHKNLSGLIKGFIISLSMVPKNIKLIVSGDLQYINDEDRKMINEVNAGGAKIIFTGYVSNATLDEIFKNADAFIFPSLHEGFGIPVLEAFYFKKPLLCSNTTSLPEIAGDAAIYFDPENPDDIAKTITFFYKNPSIWQSLIEKGQQRLNLFSWKKAGKETIALYKEILLK